MSTSWVGGREKQQRSHFTGLGWRVGGREQLRELWKPSGLWERPADRHGGEGREGWLIQSWVTHGLHWGCGLSTRAWKMLSGGGHMESYAGHSADLKASQNTDRWSLQKAAPLPSCAGILKAVTEQGQASQVGSWRPAHTVLSPNWAEELILPTGISSKWH